MLFTYFILLTSIKICSSRKFFEFLDWPHRRVGERIVGGKEATVVVHKYMSCLIIKGDSEDDDEFKGGAVIISKQWVLTAAHCMDHVADDFVQDKMFFVRSNTSKWHNRKDYIDHLVLKYYVDPKYVVNGYDYDVALIKVKNSFTGISEKPIQVAGAKYKFIENSTAQAIGWGTTDARVSDSVETLRYVTITIFKDSRCKSIYGKDFSGRMICAGSYSGGHDACLFDSGGPLVQNGKLIGIISWGDSCAQKNSPGVYARLPAFYGFLKGYEKTHNEKLFITFS